MILLLIGLGLVLVSMILGMIGGQKNKAARRYGIPGTAFLVALWQGVGWRSLAILLFIPTLAMGYGENSLLVQWLHADWIVRVVYGLMLALPFAFFGLVRLAIAAVCLVGTFSIHAGSMGTIGGFDLLAEDLIRYATLGALVFVLMIGWKR